MTSWCDLNPDLIAEILNRLELVDFIRSTAVCREWRSVLQRNPRCGPKPEAPWLLISVHPCTSVSFEPLTSLLNSPHHRLHFDFHLPQFSNRIFVGSSEGFIITVNCFSTNISAFNPFTRTHFPIPRRFPNFPEFYTQMDCYRSVISPSLDKIAALLYLYKDCGSKGIVKLVWARPGDASWTPIPIPPNTWIDEFVFYKGRLHCFCLDSLVAIFDLDNGSESYYFIAPRLSRASSWERNLVVSPAGNELLLLVRYLTGREMRQRFELFRLDETDFHWDELRDLGETALFSGERCLFSLSTSEFPSLKSNVIYFTGYAAADGGVYDLRDHNILPLNLPSHSHVPWKTWLRPSGLHTPIL